MFVTECKDGPSPSPRLDAWAMARSWAKPYVHGYEVKVSRADFIRDEKMVLYLPMCNLLSLVCPWGLIEPKEVPEGFGLLYVAKTGNRLYTKVKPPYRKVTIPEKLFRYVLMARATIRDEFTYGEGSLEYWKGWLEKSEERKVVGREVREQIAKIATKRIFGIEKESAYLAAEIRKYKEVKDILKEMGMEEGDSIWGIKNRLAEMRPEGLLRSIRSTIDGLEKFKEKLGEDN